MSPDADAKLLDRIAKLLRLATNNPSVEEARTAALQAAKLIVEHEFLIGRAAKPHPPAVPYPDLSELLRRQAEAHAAATQQQYHQAQQQREAWRQAARQEVVDELKKGGVTPDGGSWWQKVWTSKTAP